MKLDDHQLQQGFASFVAAAADLERSYVELQTRAAAVDLQLQATNQALQQALAEREAIFAALPLGLLTLDGAGKLRCCNQEGERLQALAVAAGHDLAVAAPGELALRDGRLLLRRLRLPEAELLLVEDKSQLQALEREVQRLDRLAGLSELAMGIAHEIKNPLNGVMGFAGLLQRAASDPQQARHAERIVRGVQQVDEIVKGLLAFAQPERSRGCMLPVAVVLQRAAAAAGLPSSRISSSGAMQQLVDAMALERVLAILLQNAMEAHADTRLQITASVQQQQLVVDVRDDGPGVPAAVAARAFEPFVSSKARGTGLGLPLALRVLSYLGGSLELANPGEAGACFRLRLPLTRPCVAAAELEA